MITLLRRLAANETVQDNALMMFGLGSVGVWLLVLTCLKHHWIWL